MLMSLVVGAALHRAFLELPRRFWGAVWGERAERALEAGGREGPPTPRAPICTHTGSLPRLAGVSGPKVLMGPNCPSPVGKMLGSPVQKPTMHRSISTKVLLAEGEDTPFTEHCRHYEDSYRVRGAGDLQARRPRPFPTQGRSCSRPFRVAGSDPARRN